jgi:hypothetical protein
MFSRGAQRVKLLTLVACGALLLFARAADTPSQIPEGDQDPNGVRIPYARVRLVHSDDARQEGTTAFLRARDPYLLYQLGRDLVQRQFTLADGAYGRSGELSVPLYAGGEVRGPNHGSDARFARDHTNSCGSCHSIPFREPGAGQNISSNSSAGRNAQHFYGAGLVEMLAEQTRRKILDRYDRDGSGNIERAEVTQSCPVLVAPAAGAPPIDYGNLAPGPDGVPRLNPVFRVWYTDARRRVLPDARGLNDPRVAAFGFAMQPFGWGRGLRKLADGREVSEGAEASTLRGIYTAAADVHMGLQAYDPSQMNAESDGDAGAGGEARVSLNGAQQFDFGGSVDRGVTRTASGVSLDDPDGDGRVDELTEGDVDAAEFYMLHAPAPASVERPGSAPGRALLRRVGCTRCHVEDWRIEAFDRARGFKGDRRLFHLDTRSEPDDEGIPQIVGALVPTSKVLADGARVPKAGAARVERIYSDLKDWDIGPAFYERRYDGTLQREHRTAPLWGVGSTAPYGHAGQYPTLDEVIAAHGGAAVKERAAYLSLSPARKSLLLAYLEALVLYPTDEVAADIDGDGVRADSFEVRGQSVGFERFDARFLFAVAPRYRHLYDVKDYMGRTVPLSLIENVAETYRLDLPYRRDADGDGFPDMLGPVPAPRRVAR